MTTLRAELGVDRIVSKWAAAALADVPDLARVDVTDRLVREFITPTPKQAKSLEDLKSTTPLPLAEATRLVDAGKM